jgi:hypothetical protein
MVIPELLKKSKERIDGLNTMHRYINEIIRFLKIETLFFFIDRFAYA